jgi:hypothetical protein
MTIQVRFYIQMGSGQIMFHYQLCCEKTSLFRAFLVFGIVDKGVLRKKFPLEEEI